MNIQLIPFDDSVQQTIIDIKFCFPAEILDIYDGDTIVLRLDLGLKIYADDQRLRLQNIDSPEIRTRNALEKKAGYAVRDYIRAFLADCTEVIVISYKLDKFGRLLGDLLLDARGQLLTDHLLENGLVRGYKGGARSDWGDDQLQAIIDKVTLLMSEGPNGSL